MRKLFLLLSFGFGGAESRILKVANETLISGDLICINPEFLDKTGKRNDIELVISKLIDAERLYMLPRVPKLVSNRFGLHYLWVVFFSLIVIIKKRPCVFHAVLGGILLTPFAKLLGSKTIVELTSPDNVDFCKKYNFLLSKFTDIFVAVSRSVENKAKDVLDIRSSITTYPIPYYEPKGSFVENKKVEIIEISFCARLIKRKNGLLFAQAIKLLFKRRDDFTVNIMGDGEQEEEIRYLLEKEISSNRVKLGRVPNPFDHLINSHIFVSLIEPDNYPSQSVLEAMDAGNALLLSDTGFSSEFINENGLLTDLVPADIASKLDFLIDDKNKLEYFANNSKKILNDKFNKNIFSRYAESITESLIKY